MISNKLLGLKLWPTLLLLASCLALVWSQEIRAAAPVNFIFPLKQGNTDVGLGALNYDRLARKATIYYHTTITGSNGRPGIYKGYVSRVSGTPSAADTMVTFALNGTGATTSTGVFEWTKITPAQAELLTSGQLYLSVPAAGSGAPARAQLLQNTLGARFGAVLTANQIPNNSNGNNSVNVGVLAIRELSSSSASKTYAWTLSHSLPSAEVVSLRGPAEVLKTSNTVLRSLCGAGEGDEKADCLSNGFQSGQFEARDDSDLIKMFQNGQTYVQVDSGLRGQVQPVDTFSEGSAPLTSPPNMVVEMGPVDKDSNGLNGVALVWYSKTSRVMKYHAMHNIPQNEVLYGMIRGPAEEDEEGGPQFFLDATSPARSDEGVQLSVNQHEALVSGQLYFEFTGTNGRRIRGQMKHNDDDDDHNDGPVTFVASLDQSQAMLNTSNFYPSALATVRLNRDGNRLAYRLLSSNVAASTVSVRERTLASTQTTQAQSAAPTVHTVCTTCSLPLTETVTTDTDAATVEKMKAGNYFLLMQNPNYPQGELRGQINAVEWMVMSGSSLSYASLSALAMAMLMLLSYAMAQF